MMTRMTLRVQLVWLFNLSPWMVIQLTETRNPNTDAGILPTGRHSHTLWTGWMILGNNIILRQVIILFLFTFKAWILQVRLLSLASAKDSTQPYKLISWLVHVKIMWGFLQSWAERLESRLIYSGKSGDTPMQRYSATKYNHTSQKGLGLITLLRAEVETYSYSDSSELPHAPLCADCRFPLKLSILVRSGNLHP